jgi:hypothetical protein
VPERRAAVEAETGNVQDGELHCQHIAILAARIVTGSLLNMRLLYYLESDGNADYRHDRSADAERTAADRLADRSPSVPSCSIGERTCVHGEYVASDHAGFVGR